ncbi:hypothetical protein AVEN_248734-1 [Araneus ventricosus]|uniref:Uncharacterized protein n=1 Tax=Araneus ventricosus TaxID=182803 RepID=A0A4Y2T8X9_ARAVE|nr:hypothetical protein AVEN_248734-1 [Araneus ventricosus]
MKDQKLTLLQPISIYKLSYKLLSLLHFLAAVLVIITEKSKHNSAGSVVRSRLQDNQDLPDGVRIPPKIRVCVLAASIVRPSKVSTSSVWVDLVVLGLRA